MGARSRARQRVAASAVLATAFLALCACSVPDDGPRVTRAREVAPFVRVVNRSSAVLRVRVGEPRRVRVHAGTEVVDAVRTDVHDGTLHVTFQDEGFGDSRVVLDVSVPALTGVVSEGSGEISAAAIDAQGLEVYSDGSADLRLAGAAGRVTVRSDGSGTVDLQDVAAREGEVFTTGSGDVEVHADERVDVRLGGSGDVRLHGDPQLWRRDEGSGEIERVP